MSKVEKSNRALLTKKKDVPIPSAQEYGQDQLLNIKTGLIVLMREVL